MNDATHPAIHQALEDWDRQPFTAEPLARLRILRRQLADRWLAATDAELPLLWRQLERTQALLLDSNLRYEALTDGEAAWLGSIEPVGPAPLVSAISMQHMLAIALYRRADQWLPSIRGLSLPIWAIAPFLQYCLAFPCFFREVGEVDRYAAFTIDLVDHLHEQIFRNPTSKHWQNIALTFSNYVNLVPLYFCDRNVRSTFAKRAAIIEFALGLAGSSLGFEFGPRPAHRSKIRLGILKANYLSHPETFTTFPVFEWLDREQFEVILYVIDRDPDLLDEYQKRRSGDRIVQLTGELAEQVQTIRDDDLDILLVGTIVTNSLHRVLKIGSHRLARVQIHSVSSPVTSGMTHVDYYLSGTLTETDTANAHYTEQLMLVEGPAHCFDYSLETPQPQLQIDRPSIGLTETTIAFVSGANLYKTIPELRATWAKLLAKIPDSVLLLCPFGASWKRHYPKVQFWRRLQETLQEFGVNPDRLIVFDQLPSRDDVKAVLRLADVYLDSFPFGGANSIVDAIEVGLPVVARESDWFRSRQGAAILRDVGLADWIADSETAYLDRATRLAQDPTLRRSIRDRLAQTLQQPPRCLNSRAYAAQLQPLLQAAIAQWTPQPSHIRL
ncbi:MAG TPA: hypothetical protein V6D46_07995 [Coleofasciculaceae cyanobacterium]